MPQWAPDGRTIYLSVCRKVDFGWDCNIFAAPLERAERWQPYRQ